MEDTAPFGTHELADLVIHVVILDRDTALGEGPSRVDVDIGSSLHRSDGNPVRLVFPAVGVVGPGRVVRKVS